MRLSAQACWVERADRRRICTSGAEQVPPVRASGCLRDSRDGGCRRGRRVVQRRRCAALAGKSPGDVHMERHRLLAGGARPRRRDAGPLDRRARLGRRLSRPGPRVTILCPVPWPNHPRGCADRRRPRYARIVDISFAAAADGRVLLEPPLGVAQPDRRQRMATQVCLSVRILGEYAGLGEVGLAEGLVDVGEGDLLALTLGAGSGARGWPAGRRTPAANSSRRGSWVEPRRIVSMSSGTNTPPWRIRRPSTWATSAMSIPDRSSGLARRPVALGGSAISRGSGAQASTSAAAPLGWASDAGGRG